MATIWIDADAAPRACKDIVYRASERRRLPVVLVANKPQVTPRSALVRFVLVGAGFDVADEHIAAQVQAGDLVITADIPLAAAVIDRGATVIDPRGSELDEKNVRQKLSVRDFLDELRGSGVITGGPPPYGDREKQQFANALDRWVTRSTRPL